MSLKKFCDAAKISYPSCLEQIKSKPLGLGHHTTEFDKIMRAMLARRARAEGVIRCPTCGKPGFKPS